MNILQILPELNVGGVERGTVDLSKYLVKAGHKAVVVSNGGSMVEDLVKAGVIHYKLPVHKKSLFHILMMIPKLAEIIKKENIDIVHARSRIPAWIAYFACRKTKRVFITTCHGYYKKHPISYCMGWGKQVIVPSNVIARHMIEDFGVPHDRIRLIPRSVEIEKFQFISPEIKRKNIFNVGIVGRITPLKGHLDFIKAMALVKKQVPNIKVWIVGEAPSSKEAYKEQIKILTKRLGLGNCTEFLGSKKNIPEVMANLDTLVLATKTQEAFGRVIIEAQAAGVPVVATAVGGVIDIIEDGKNGFLVSPSDPQGMADAVLKIYKDKVLAQNLAENAYEKVKKEYKLELMVERTLNVYKEALTRHNFLVIKFSSIGDIILSTAGIKALRDKFPRPDYKMVFLTSLENKEILLRNPHIDELVVCDFKNRDKGLSGLLNLAKRFRKNNIEFVVDFQNNRKSHILAGLSLAQDRYGYNKKKFSFLLNHKIKEDKAPIDPVTHQFRSLKMLNIESKNLHLELYPTEQDQNLVEEFLKSQWVSKGQKLVGINISASKRWLTKVWPMEHLVVLCEELAKKDIRVVVTGTDADKNVADELCEKIKGIKIINSCGQFSINQLACLIKRCSVYISADSAPLHVAASVDTPIIALFGPTDSRRHMPPSGKSVLINKKVNCSPCYKSKCSSMKCMKTITPIEVYQAIQSLI